LAGLAVLTLAAGVPAQQRDPTAKPIDTRVGSAIVAGRVMSSETGDTPVRRAIVTLTSTERVESVSAVTDNEGRFALTDLAGGRYTLNARKAAHLSVNYGAKRPGRPGTTLILSAGQRLTELRLVLQPGAVITGVVRLPNGDPVTNTQVVAIPVAQANAGGRYVEQTIFRTDDRGEYRIYGLMPDTYLVAVTPSLGRTEIHQRAAAEYDELFRILTQRPPQPLTPGAAPTLVPAPPPVPLFGFAPNFYPGTPIAANASPITVRAGEVRDGVDIPVAMVRVGAISGVVRGIDGRPTQNVQLTVAPGGPALPLSASVNVRTSRPDKDGRFTLTNVAPGSYRITARGGGVTYTEDGTGMTIRGEQQTQWAVADVQVQGEDVDGVMLQLQPGLTLTGRMVATGNAPQPETWKGASIRIQEPRSGPVGVVLNGVPTSAAASRTANAMDDGTFEISGVQPATYEIDVTLPAALRSTWSVKSIMAGGRELRDTPLTFDQGSLTGVTVTLTDQPTQLAGTLSSASGQAATDYYVVLFPEDRALWHERSPRLRVMRPAADGTFTTRDLLPGQYRIAALTDVEEGEWRTAAFLESIVDASIAVSFTDGQTTRQDIRIR
jgi:protocatechuate 3,4-dioxygenase beta subunit